MSDDNSREVSALKNVSIPPNLGLSAHGFPEEAYARDALHKIHSILSVISQYIDLSNLDGVTVSFEYDQSLAKLDRGYETSYVLTATKDVATGVAMAPSVIRNGKLKTHLVMNAEYVLSLLEKQGQETEFFNQALHLVAHECAHVEVTARFDTCFPNVLLKKRHENILDELRWQVILPTWDEYAVCRIAGSIGMDPTNGYLETLKLVLEKTRVECVECVKQYRLHGNVEQVVTEIYGKLGNLMKFTAYYLGALHSANIENEKPEFLKAASGFDWYKPYFEKSERILVELFSQYGEWPDQKAFEQLGDVLEEMAEDIGVFAERQDADAVYFDIPYRAESMV